jgi:formate-dependent phosphoribosylglycinamide formyltransferase (GAR transformylase)
VDVLMISPGYPAEMAQFTRGLAQVGARVVGLGDQPVSALPAVARDALTHHLHVRSLTDGRGAFEAVASVLDHVRFQRVECLWEPYMGLAAELREALGVPGLTAEQTERFRDKELMKQQLDQAGIRTPWHQVATTADGVRTIAERIGYPLIVKPIAGYGSADTYRVDDEGQLEHALPRLRAVPVVSVEEFVDGEEFTYDTICAEGRVLFENIGWYRPRPLVMRQNEWISPVYVALRDLDAPDLRRGREMGRAVLDALGFRDGFTHMEWYRKADGEVVFGEIGARSPGARTVEVMNHATESDLFLAWAEAVVHGRVSQAIGRRHNAAAIFKRARGHGRITHVEGLTRLLSEYGDHVVTLDLAPIGAPRADWQASVTADGVLIVRHPDLGSTLEMADRFAAELHLHAA